CDSWSLTTVDYASSNQHRSIRFADHSFGCAIAEDRAVRVPAFDARFIERGVKRNTVNDDYLGSFVDFYSASHFFSSFVD
ncbi:hypothetical protein JTM45_32695, partial [Pseudomonas aeruginosa]|nr:hypothetical protein [Pseudomonas aeruginosa]